MGSVQTTRTVCDHPDLFSEVGIFSGFLRDFIEGNPDRDVVDRKPYEQTHLKAMDNPAFNSYFHTFLRCIGDKDSFLPGFWQRMKLSGKRVFMKSEGFIPESMTGMCGDLALRILRR